jgi:hypothetical protein
MNNNKTTAIYKNRIEMKKYIENKYKLEEFGSGNIKFYSKMEKILIAEGYTRVVYGDHGAYLEMDKRNIKWEAFSICARENIGYYDIYYTKDKVKLYLQRMTVSNLPNPPKGQYSVDNNCPDGYADYKIGYCYISPDDISLSPDNPIIQQDMF